MGIELEHLRNVSILFRGVVSDIAIALSNDTTRSVCPRSGFVQVGICPVTACQNRKFASVASLPPTVDGDSGLLLRIWTVAGCGAK